MFRLSLQRRLLGVTMLTSLVATLVALGAMVAYDLHARHEGWVEDLTAQAELLGRATAPAVRRRHRAPCTTRISRAAGRRWPPP